MLETSTMGRALLPANAMQLKKIILKLRWIGQEEEANALLHDLAELEPSGIFPTGPRDTD